MEQYQFIEKPSFVDYLKGGLQLNMTVAIDFTGSNGPPSFPTSLHFHNDFGYANQYQQAITSIGRIIMQYDSDRKIPAYGFGAKTNYDGTLS